MRTIAAALLAAALMLVAGPRTALAGHGGGELLGAQPVTTWGHGGGELL